MRWTLALPLVVLAACSDKGAEAEARFEMVERNGTKGEACEAAREVTDHYLQAGDEKKYRLWLARSGMKCQLAELTGSDLPAKESKVTEDAADAANAAMEAAEKAASDAAGADSITK